MSRLVKIIIAFIFAIALMGGFLYVKFKKYPQVNSENTQIVTAPTDQGASKSEKEVLESLAVPQTESKTEAEIEDEKKVLESLSVKQEQPRDEKADLEILKSLSAPVK